MNNKKSFVLDSKSLKIKEVLNQDFMEIEILAVSEGLNRNNSYFTLDSMEKAIPTFYNKFIMGYYRVNNLKSGEGVFEEHNSDMRYDKELDEFYWSYTAPNAEKPLGLVRESDKVEIIDVDGKKWITLTAVILTKYNREAVKHLLKSKGKRKISVEITVVKSHEKDGIEIIEEFILDAITILGNRKNSTVLCEEGIEGASLKIINFEQALQKQKEAVCFAYKELDEGLSVNEEVEEIEMKNNNLEEDDSLINNEKEMEGLALTYEQKRDILEGVLRKQKCSDIGDYIWVADLSDEEVFFCFNGDYYKTTYSIDDELEDKCSIDIENCERVVRDWKTFVETNQEEVEAEEEAVVSESNQEIFSENDDVNVVEENINTEEEQSSTEKFEKVEDTEENEEKFEEEEETKEDNEGSKDEDSDKEDEEKEDFSKENSEEEEKPEECDDKENHCSCGKENCDCSSEEETKETEEECENYQEKYEEMVSKYSELEEKFQALEKEKSGLSATLEEIKFTQTNAEMLAYGYELISNEKSLDETDMEALKVSFKEACENEKYTEKTQVENYMNVNIPKIFYERHKEDKINKNEENKQEEFSMQFNTTVKTVVEETSMNKMRTLLNIK